MNAHAFLQLLLSPAKLSCGWEDQITLPKSRYLELIVSSSWVLSILLFDDDQRGTHPTHGCSRVSSLAALAATPRPAAAAASNVWLTISFLRERWQTLTVNKAQVRSEPWPVQHHYRWSILCVICNICLRYLVTTMLMSWMIELDHKQDCPIM